MWLDRTFGEWTSVRTGLVSPSWTWLKACGITLFGSAGGVLMNASQYGSRSLSLWRENGKRTRSSEGRPKGSGTAITAPLASPLNGVRPLQRCRLPLSAELLGALDEAVHVLLERC